jgi:hypothetical protein
LLAAGAFAIHDEVVIIGLQSKLSSAAISTSRVVSGQFDQGLPRAQLAEGQLLALSARTETLHAKRLAGLSLAHSMLRNAAAARPAWGDAQTALAFVAAQRYGPHSAEAVAAIEKSYTDLRYSRGGAAWRVELALANWQRLNEPLRAQVINEAVWLTSSSFGVQQTVFTAMRHSPAYRPFMTRYYTFRLSKSDR